MCEMKEKLDITECNTRNVSQRTAIITKNNKQTWQM